MAQYFFKMSQTEKNDILDKHKSLYDGYVTEYANGSNTQPLYVQDFANDKNGITVSNKGEVKHYTNTKINEDIDRRDQIADGSDDLENPDFMHDLYPSPSEEDIEIDDENFYPSYDPSREFKGMSQLMGDMDFEDENFYPSYDPSGEFKGMSQLMGDMDIDTEEMMEDSYEYDIDEIDDFSSQPLDEFDEDNNLMESVNKSLDMFKRFKNYN